MSEGWDESDLLSGVAQLTAWLAEDYYRSFYTNNTGPHVGFTVAELVERLGGDGRGEDFVRAVIAVLDGEDLVTLVSEAALEVTSDNCDAVMLREHSVRTTWMPPEAEGTPPIRRHTGGRAWQAKDIPDELFLGAVARSRRGLSVTVQRELVREIGPVPLKLVVAKARALIRQGRLEGCGCGCRGDWALPQHEGKENI